MSNELTVATLLHSALLDASVDGIVAFDRDYRYLAWNKAMECISGVTRDQVLGKCAFDLFPFLQETGESKYFLEALAGKSLVAENRPFAIPQTGRAGFFEAYYSPLRSGDGDVVGCVAVVRDITERKRVEQLANEAHRRLTLHVENTPLAVIEWNNEFKVSRWSPSAERLFGWKADEVVGKTINDWPFVFSQDVEAVYEVSRRQQRGSERHGVSRNRNYTKQGAVLHCEWYNSVLYDESGRMISVLSLVLDVTARRLIEEAMRQSEQQYRVLFESNPNSMWVYDTESLRFLAVNDAAIEQYGYSRDEFLSMTIAQIRPPEDVPNFTMCSRAGPLGWRARPSGAIERRMVISSPWKLPRTNWTSRAGALSW